MVRLLAPAPVAASHTVTDPARGFQADTSSGTIVPVSVRRKAMRRESATSASQPSMAIGPLT